MHEIHTTNKLRAEKYMLSLFVLKYKVRNFSSSGMTSVTLILATYMSPKRTDVYKGQEI